MGVTKTDQFAKRHNDLAKLAKALGHPARIAILEYLIKKDECITGDIVQALPLAQATISQHLRELKDAGLVQGSVEGTTVCYCIDSKRWAAMRGAIDKFLQAYKGGDCC